tara:strand:- start:96 stop:533 length:438 start_codon:yes stop_codon:yes gene_type:complete
LFLEENSPIKNNGISIDYLLINKFMKELLTILAFVLFNTLAISSPLLDCTNSISDKNFQIALKTIKTHNFDEAKKEATAKLLSGNCFTSLQVKTLVEIFSFEEHKLELVKLAYSHVIDKDNFGILLTIFAFEDAKEELLEFIKNN